MSDSFKKLILELKVQMETEGATAEARQLAASILGVGDAGETASGKTTRGMDRLGQASQASGQQVGYVFAQLNDIGVMMAAGQNPFQLAIQQGTQLTQVFGPLGVRGSLTALSGAFLQLLSPINLVTIGGIAAGAAMVSWLTSSGDEAETLEEKLSDLTSQLKNYQDAVDATSVSHAELEDRFGIHADKVRAQLGAALEDERRKLEFEIETVLKLTVDETEIDFAEVSRQSRAELAPLFDLEVARGTSVRQARPTGAAAENAEMIDLVVEGYERLEEAATGSTATQIAAMEQLIAAFDSAARASGTISEEENNRLIVLRDLLLKLYELQALEEKRDAESNTKARELDDELSRKLDLTEAERRYGEKSAEVHNLRLAQARAQQQAEIELLRITKEEKQALLEKWDAANPQRDPIAERSKAAVEQFRQIRAEYQARQQAAQDYLQTLQEENEIQAAINAHGEESAKVAELRTAQARRIFEARLDELGVTEEVKDALRAAWAEGEKLNATNMSDGIRAAANEALRVADELVRALAASQSLSATAAGALEDAKIRAKYAGDPVETARQLGVQKMIRTQGVRRDGAEGGELAALDAEARQYGDTMARIAAEDLRTRNQLRSSAGGRNRRAGDTLKSLNAEAQELLLALGIAVDGVNEKVKAGLLSTAEGERAIDQATERAAGSIADLIPRLERMGPAGAASVDQLREKLKGLAGDLNDVKEKAREAISGSFSGALTDAITKTGEAQNAFVSLGNEIVNQIARIVSQKFTNKFVDPLINGLLSIFPFADGGVPGGELKQYRDQVVSEPTFFGMPDGNLGVFAEAGEEAIMPLRQYGGGHGVLATGPDGSEGVLPLERTGSGALGVALPADLLAMFVPGLPGRVQPGQDPVPFAKGGVPGADPVRRPDASVPGFSGLPDQPDRKTREPADAQPAAPTGLETNAGDPPSVPRQIYIEGEAPPSDPPALFPPRPAVPAAPAPGGNAAESQGGIAADTAPERRPETPGPVFPAGLLSLFGQRPAPGSEPDPVAFAKGGLPGGDLQQYRDQIVSEPTFFTLPDGTPGQFAEDGDEAIMPLRQLGGGHGVLATGPDGDEGVLPLERTASGALGVSLPADLLAAFAPAALQSPPAAPYRDAAQSPAYFAKGGVFGALSRSAPAPALPAAAAPAARSGDGKPDVVVNVHNNANSSEATVRESNDGGTRMIDVLIEQVEAKMASNVRRGVGPLAGVMKSGGYS